MAPFCSRRNAVAEILGQFNSSMIVLEVPRSDEAFCNTNDLLTV